MKFQKSFGRPTPKGRRVPGVHHPGARHPSARGEWVPRGASAFVSLALPVLGLDRRRVDGSRDRGRGGARAVGLDAELGYHLLST